MKRATYLFPVVILSIAILMTSCARDEPQPQPTTQPGAPAPAAKTFVPSAEAVPQTQAQLKTLLANVKKWKAAGHSYAELNNKRAISDGLVPKEMIGETGLMNLFGGPADIGLAPANAGAPDTFLVLFSGVPNESCVKLAFPATDFIVYAGDFLKPAASEAQAKSLCTTGNMWFVAK